MESKRGLSGLGWIIIILILIAIGAGLYIWLSGDGGSVANLGGSGIPTPPALPN